MSAEKWTKGEWYWDEEVPTEHSAEFFAEHAPWLRSLQDGGCAGNVLTGEIACPNPSNLHLIAAAPDLYEALEAVIAVADRSTVEFDAARAALARARGESGQGRQG